MSEPMTSAEFKKRSAGFIANHLARLFHQSLAVRIAPLGLAPAQFMVLLELWTIEGLTQRDLIERLHVEQATMANTLARMQRDGLIVRRPVKGDRRSKGVWLTEKARALEGPARREAEAVNASALSGLDSSERAALLSLMSRAAAGLLTALEGAGRP